MVMAASNTQIGQSLLFVFDGMDEAISRCGEEMMSHGARVEWSPDVYSAMALLASGSIPDRLIVDVRGLDNHEMQFLQLAPRYYPSLRLTVARISGAAERIGGLQGRFDIATLTEIYDETLGIRPAVATNAADETEVVQWRVDDATDVVEMGVPIGEVAAPNDDERGTTWGEESDAAHVWPPENDADSQAIHADEYDLAEIDLERAAPRDVDSGDTTVQRNMRPLQIPLSTDGVTDEAAGGPSLHEAVRQRMGGIGPAPARRLPPAALEHRDEQASDGRAGEIEQGPAPSHELTDSRSTITPEEMDALLHDDASDEAPDDRMDEEADR